MLWSLRELLSGLDIDFEETAKNESAMFVQTKIIMRLDYEYE